MIINYQKNDRTVPLCSNIFEKVIFKSLFRYLNDNNRLTLNQLGFQLGDSCVDQLWSMTCRFTKRSKQIYY